jgi:hypothetical protein
MGLAGGWLSVGGLGIRGLDLDEEWARSHHRGLSPILWRVSSSYRPVQAMAILKCLQCCQIFREFCGHALFVQLVMHPCFSVSPSRQRRGARV